MRTAIREMTIEDYDAVLTLWQATEGMGLDLQDADSRPAVQAYLLRNAGLSFVTQSRERIVGAVLCGHDGRRGYMNHLAVSPAFRGQGLAAGMIEACLAALARAGIAKCSLFVFTDNAPGVAFWSHNGWNNRHDLALFQKKTPAQ